MADEKKSYPTPRGEAANRAKIKYNRKTYDRMELLLPKGKKDELKEYAKQNGYKSVNNMVITAVDDLMREGKRADE